MSKDDDRLIYFPGSPFARMGRVFIREWHLPIAETEAPFPPPDWLFELNPLGQVPALALGEERLFPTVVILERLWELAGSPASAHAPESERQLLLTTLQAGDALVAALYQRWAGLAPVGENHVGYDPAARNLARFASVLGWVAVEGRLREGLTLPGVAVACLLLWSDARGGPAWWEHDGLAALVDGLAARESFRETQPQPWRPG
jgi:glutathione S-transferase